MRVSVGSLAEFIVCLESEKTVFLDTVRWAKFENALGGSRLASVKFDISVHASAVVVQEGGTEYLLEADEHCGMDIRDASKCMEGSEIADSLYKALSEYVKSRGWRILPGVIHE